MTDGLWYIVIVHTSSKTRPGESRLPWSTDVGPDEPCLLFGEVGG